MNTDWTLLHSTNRHAKLGGSDAHYRISIGYLSACGGNRWRSWLIHWATRRKVAGSIPDSVFGIFIDFLPAALWPWGQLSFLTEMITYLLTPWCRVLLEKLNGLQLVKKFPAFHGTRRFITALTSVCHLSLSWANPIQSIYPHPTSWRSILILSAHLRLGLPSGFLPSGFPTKTLYTPFTSPIRATCPAHLINRNDYHEYLLEDKSGRC